MNFNDANDEFPVRSCRIFKEDRMARVELNSIDEADRLKVIGKIPI